MCLRNWRNLRRDTRDIHVGANVTAMLEAPRPGVLSARLLMPNLCGSQAHAVHIEIAETKNHARYQVYFLGELIIKSTRTPLLSAARVLRDRGADPGEVLEMVRRGSDRVDMRGKIGEIAELTVSEPANGNKPVFVKYKKFPGREVEDDD
jgi:hypothetical protein